MNLQELLNYRSTCFIHQQFMHVYIRPEIRTYDFIIEQTNDGISIWGKQNKPHGGAQFNFNGTFNINKNQRNLIYFLNPQTFRVGMMCPKCHSVPFIDRVIKKSSLVVGNMKDSFHFYTFFISTENNLDGKWESGKYQIYNGMEMINYRDDKLYHMNGRIGGGEGNFQMTHYGKMTLTEMMNSQMNLNVPNFDPSNIKSLEQLKAKIKLYNVFS